MLRCVCFPVVSSASVSSSSVSSILLHLCTSFCMPMDLISFCVLEFCLLSYKLRPLSLFLISFRLPWIFSPASIMCSAFYPVLVHAVSSVFNFIFLLESTVLFFFFFYPFESRPLMITFAPFTSLVSSLFLLPVSFSAMSSSSSVLHFIICQVLFFQASFFIYWSCNKMVLSSNEDRISLIWEIPSLFLSLIFS